MYDIENFTCDNLHSLVVDYLKKKILLGQYKGGYRIVESEIAKELNVSRAPVREGIRELESRGLILSIPRKGNFVSVLNPADIKEIFDIRMMLEDSVMEIIIREKKLTDKDYDKLTEIVNRMVEATKENVDEDTKILNLNKKDLEFHQYLWKKSESKRRAKILSDLHFQLQVAMVYDTKVTADLEKTAKDHYPIIKYLKMNSLNNCQKAFREHVETIRLATISSDTTAL